MHVEAWTRGFCGYVIAVAQRASSYVAMITQFIARSLTQSKHDYISPLKPINFLIQRGWGQSASQRYTGKTACGSDRWCQSFRSPQRRNFTHTCFFVSSWLDINLKFKSRSSSRAACRLVTKWMIYKEAEKRVEIINTTNSCPAHPDHLHSDHFWCRNSSSLWTASWEIGLILWGSFAEHMKLVVWRTLGGSILRIRPGIG